MKGTSKVIMGVTLTMLISLAIVLLLVLLLLAELYCSLLLRRRPKTTTTTPTITATDSASASASASTLSYGVIRAPINFLFNADGFDLETQNKNLTSADRGGTQCDDRVTTLTDSVDGHGDDDDDCCVYISNPVYDLEADNNTNDDDKLDCVGVETTPFETPDSTPPCESAGDCSPASELSVELTPMKEIPAKACSVSLKDASSFGNNTSRSDFSVVSNGNGVVSSSSSSCSPSTSSW